MIPRSLPSRFHFRLLALLLLAAMLSAGCVRLQRDPVAQARDAAFVFLEEGIAKRNAGDLEGAIASFQQALIISPRPAINFHLGSTYAESGDLQRAEKYLLDAIEMQPDYPLAQIELERVRDLILAAETPSAPEPIAAAPAEPAQEESVAATPPPAQPAESVTTTGRRDPREPSFDEIHAVLFAESGRQEPSPARMEDLADGVGRHRPTATGELSHSSDQPIVLNTFAYHFNTGRGMLESREYEKAAAEFSRALALEPNNFTAQLLLGDALAAQGKTQAALDNYQQVIDKNSDAARAYFRIGNLYAREATTDSLRHAEQAYRKTIELDPTAHLAYYNLAVLAMRAGNSRQAVEYFEQVLRLQPNNLNSHLYLGVLYADRLGEPEKARHHYQRYLDLDGDRSGEVRRWLNDLK